ncbi:wall-associated receptor kinase 2-like [Durio zibethinus]|uniref:Wall-associated receptor kinase 2-like n=1 Tax=Durio zibethinus TaxID=66656 RepID=A0A6P5ZG51_DURZI|nr:wall-associated receptor kinase 2-like [Durio zibethinus]
MRKLCVEIDVAVDVAGFIDVVLVVILFLYQCKLHGCLRSVSAAVFVGILIRYVPISLLLQVLRSGTQRNRTMTSLHQFLMLNCSTEYSAPVEPDCHEDLLDKPAAIAYNSPRKTRAASAGVADLMKQLKCEAHPFESSNFNGSQVPNNDIKEFQECLHVLAVLDHPYTGSHLPGLWKRRRQVGKQLETVKRKKLINHKGEIYKEGVMDSHTRLAVGTLVWLVLAATAATVTRAQALAKPGCPASCGNLSIPYPFGTREDCFLNPNFHIICNDSANSSTAFLASTDFVVTNISVEGRLQILATVARDCYKVSGDSVIPSPQIVSSFPLSIFNVSNTRNKFTAIGCDTYAFLLGSVGNKYYRAGCMALCNRIEDLVDGSCSGFGCCQIQIPDGLKNIDVIAYSFNNHSQVSDFNPCSYAFVVEENQFEFSSDYVRSIPEDYKFPMSLDWVVGNETCEEAEKNTPNYACHQSECYEPGIGMGYLCKCPDGYEGNPYLPEGCIDIDECKISSPCYQNAECHNFAGSFKCICGDGYEGDGKINGTGCSSVHKPKGFPFVNIALGMSISILVLILSLSWIYWGLWQRQLIKQKEEFFQQNGGIILQREFSKHKGPVAAKIFTAEELKKATNNYHESRILGQGGHGTVYKGILQDNRVVAIKKSTIADNSQVEQFINEVIVLSQVNHRNVVKLLGCCLETEVPLLVYEFITNGTLYHHLHGSGLASFIPWEGRLRIAADTAGALSYLHSAANPPIIHRDVKSTNILLDEHYTAKVSDFGASRLVPSDQTQLTTLVQGTLGYLDPEYFLSSQLTEKSDVYSFGVVLVELLTGRKALCFQMPEEERNLAMHFVSALKKDRLFKIIDHRVLLEENTEQIQEVAMLAKSCLRVRGEERPSMKEVATELEGLTTMKKHPWVKVDVDLKETENLLDEVSGANARGTNSNPSGYDSIRQEIILHGR